MTFARISVAVAVQMNFLGFEWSVAMCSRIAKATRGASAATPREHLASPRAERFAYGGGAGAEFVTACYPRPSLECNNLPGARGLAV